MILFNRWEIKFILPNITLPRITLSRIRIESNPTPIVCAYCGLKMNTDWRQSKLGDPIFHSGGYDIKVRCGDCDKRLWGHFGDWCKNHPFINPYKKEGDNLCGITMRQALQERRNELYQTLRTYTLNKAPRLQAQQRNQLLYD